MESPVTLPVKVKLILFSVSPSWLFIFIISPSMVPVIFCVANFPEWMPCIQF